MAIFNFIQKLHESGSLGLHILVDFQNSNLSRKIHGRKGTLFFLSRSFAKKYKTCAEHGPTLPIIVNGIA